MKGLVLLDWQFWESDSSYARNEHSTDGPAAIFLLCTYFYLELICSSEMYSFKSCFFLLLVFFFFVCLFKFTCKKADHNDSSISLQDPNLLKNKRMRAVWGIILQPVDYCFFWDHFQVRAESSKPLQTGHSSPKC